MTVSLDGTVRAWDADGDAQGWRSSASAAAAAAAAARAEVEPTAGLGRPSQRKSAWRQRSAAAAPPRAAADAELACACLLPVGRVLAAGTETGDVQFWMLGTSTCTVLAAHANTVSAIAAGEDASCGDVLLATGSYDGDLALWGLHAKDGPVANRLPKLEQRVAGAHGRRDASLSAAAATTAPSAAAALVDTEVLALAFVGRAGLLASGGNDGAVRCWCARARRRLAELVPESPEAGDAEAVTCMAVTSMASARDHLYVGHHGGFVRLWSTEHVLRGGKGVLLGVVAAHEAAVSSMCLLPGRSGWPTLLATCSPAEGTVRVWGCPAPQELEVELQHQDGSSSSAPPLGALVAELSEELQGARVSCLACLDGRLYGGCAGGEVLQLPYNVAAERRGTACDVPFAGGVVAAAGSAGSGAGDDVGG
eukprot:TRINITY_DN16788_c0_g1_i4.p1 TRINITY_DN16788_c0_g1~~TRINITY_DN16788_c0_g1_i4.p1  ORF type:complete len:423 (-),score=142.28 TRINITY_DN16788_c0_g1_i4:39-1307(-)